MADYDVIVVGAGYGGITAARDLADSGASVLVVEGRDRIGGRTHSRNFEGRDDLIIELGGAWVSMEHNPNVKAEIERYGIEVAPAEGAIENLVVLSDGKRRVGMPIPVEEIEPFERAIIYTSEAAERINVGVPLSAQRLADLDVTPTEFYAPLDLPPATQSLIEDLFSGYSGAAIEETSMLHLLYWVAGCGGSPFFTFIGVLDYTFVNGTADLLNSMIEGSNLEVRLETTVETIRHGADGVELMAAGGESISARSCVVAVPVNTMRYVSFEPALGAAKTEALKHESDGRGVKQFMIVENADPGLFAIGPDLFGFMAEEQKLEDGTTLMVAVTSKEDVDPHSLEVAQEWVGGFMPGATVVATDGHAWPADRYSHGSAWVSPPGQAMTFTTAMNEPEGAIVFAGSDVVEDPFWGWIEGAVVSGHRAAHRVGVLLSGSR